MLTAHDLLNPVEVVLASSVCHTCASRPSGSQGMARLTLTRISERVPRPSSWRPGGDGAATPRFEEVLGAWSIEAWPVSVAAGSSPEFPEDASKVGGFDVVTGRHPEWLLLEV